MSKKKKPSSTRALPPSPSKLCLGLCDQPPMVRRCETCGSEMTNVDVLFFLATNERSWNIPLPICKKCSREKYPYVSDAVGHTGLGRAFISDLEKRKKRTLPPLLRNLGGRFRNISVATLSTLVSATSPTGGGGNRCA